MTLTQLKYAITVSEAGSMNQAAKELFISQPSLSLAIRDLEEEIGVETVQKIGRILILFKQSSKKENRKISAKVKEI